MFTTLYSNGITVSTMTFPSRKEMEAWDAEVRGIKKAIADINKSEEEGHITTSTRDQLYKLWVKRVKALAKTHGDNQVPDDIKWAVNNVEENCGWDKTKWEKDIDTSFFDNK